VLQSFPMLEFKILKRSKKSRARLGILKTPHGEVETPAYVTVGTQAAVKTMTAAEVKEAGTQLIICNTFHLHLKPGEKVVKANGGLHKFMAWDKPLMTDSGGFQVFSLGFGRDHGIGKILKTKTDEVILSGQQPKLLKIGEDGVEFTSYVDGKVIVLTPKSSIKIQEALGADIIFAFDEPTSPIAEKDYIITSLERTHRWAGLSLKAKTSNKQSIYGIVQGGRYKDLRIQSAKLIGAMDFDGFGIGGEFGGDKKVMTQMLRWTNEQLPEGKPRHLLGIGHPEDIVPIIKEGVDTFDCIVPTHYARRGVAFTSTGRYDLKRALALKDRRPIDPKCKCRTCGTYTRSYIAHLFKANEIGAMSLTTFHNIHWFNEYVAKLRNDIKKGLI
jgi:queuine tRNA-ribosyltransferase